MAHHGSASFVAVAAAFLRAAEVENGSRKVGYWPVADHSHFELVPPPA